MTTSQSRNLSRFNIAFFSLFAWIFYCSSTIATESSPFGLTEVADGLYVHNGVHVRQDQPQHDDIANIGFIVGDNCVAVIDTGGSIRIGQRLRKALRKTTSKPICYVINTHVHYDHVLGNYAFVKDKPKFVGHRSLKAAIEANRPFFLENFAEDLGTNAKPNWIIAPSESVTKTKTIDLGNRTLVLTAHPTAHTNQDLTVLDVKTNTLWIADILFMQRVPVINGSINGWLKIIDSLKKKSIDRVVPGHGPVSADWPQAVGPQLRYLENLRSEIRKIIENGGFLEDALEQVGHSERGKWLLFEQYHKRNITRAFAELEWE